MRKVIIWTSADLGHWRKYAALGGDALNTLYIHVRSAYDVHAILPLFQQLYSW